MRKLAPNESVLSPGELVAQRMESLAVSNPNSPGHSQGQLSSSRAPSSSGIGGDDEAYTEDESVYEEAVEAGHLSEPVPLLPTPQAAVSPGAVAATTASAQPRRRTSSKRHQSLYNPAGVKVASVKLRQLKEAMSIADIESGPTPVQRYEHAGRGLASLILSIPPRPTSAAAAKQSTNPAKPAICILCDDCEKGQIALRAGTFLANRSCRVVAYILSTANHDEGFRTNLRMFSSAGGRIVRALVDLDTKFDLVVDAIADCDVQGQL